MPKFLISFPSATMDVPDDDLPAVAEAAHEVVREARAAGVHVFSGGIDERVAPVLVHADGSLTPQTSALDGGFCVLDLPSRREAEWWAARMATGCRTPQELRQFYEDPEA